MYHKCTNSDSTVTAEEEDALTAEEAATAAETVTAAEAITSAEAAAVTEERIRRVGKHHRLPRSQTDF